ncbi:MAG TPA: beta-ketoacyl synthase N-terminal-like domain-containing protein [Jatrophihabitans sp.]|nr:beta-ketoacyl synthase N-terminal-like domain-containing protein [Jatrophihabitans sp.]
MTGAAEPLVLVPREDVALRLFAFPHAGGSPQIFADWAADLPGDVELVSFSMPGRGRLQGEPPYGDWPRLVADLMAAVAELDDGAPFAFFGHSFGSLVAFEVARTLAEQRRRTPEILFLSAHRAPHLAPAAPAHTLPEPRFLDLVRSWGLVPEEFLRDEELLTLMLPPLRADLALDAGYPCRTGPDAPLGIPVVVYGGVRDGTVQAAELAAWRQHVEPDSFVGTELFDGGHFYSISHRADLLTSIAGHLGRVRRALPPSLAVAGPAYTGGERSLWDRFADQVAATPDAPALLDRDRRWNYRELHESAGSLAAELAGLGHGRGDVVGLLLPHSAEYCIGLLSCFGLGAPACLLETNWPASLLAQFLTNAGVRVVVTVPGLVGQLPAEFQQPDRLVVLGADRWTSPPRLAPAALPPVAPDDIALISMTSGTSGTPKAVLNTHLGCLYCFDARYQSYPYGETSRDGLNVFFGWECLRPLLAGRPAVVIPDDCIVDPVRLVDTLAEHRITRIVVPPSLFESVLDHPAAGPALVERLGHLEVIFLMGEVVPGRVVDKAAALLPQHVRLVNAYSTWESLDVSFADLLPRLAGAARSPFAPVGRILAGSAAILLNDKGEPVPYGGVGELHFAGPGVATGYLNDPAKTAERFVPCPPALAGTEFGDQTFYRTGDRARFLPGGELEILGRTGEVVKVRGFKVSLRAVEHVLEDVPGVSRVIVRPVLDARTSQPTSLLGYVLGEHGAPSETVLARVGQRARRDLPEYARPRRYLGLDALPISTSDSRKLDLAALPVPPAEDEPAPAAGLSTVERRIAQAWGNVLGTAVTDPDANFFDAGGDSLSAARLSGVLADRYGIALPVIDVFQFSTLRAMAAHCSGSRTAGDLPRRRPAPAAGAKLAVVGLAGRFPGAPDVETFWQNLLDGVDSLTTYEPELLRAKGLGEAMAHPNWVPAGQVLDGADGFDAEFWGIGHREAVLMDPQHRVFLEVAWAALEQAGYARRDNPHRRRTGVFAACGIDGYLVHHLDGGGLRDPLDPGGIFLTEIGNEKDYLATRVAYQLNLGGPAFTVTSACSSALVAVAQAAQSILTGQCDLAVAGASSINFPNLGYRYEDGLVGSLDGTVRPFDDAASGTLFGDSVGAVVLKRLDDAIADGDQVWAVLTGFGISNDGSMKAGYTAPSALAQAQCISDAFEMAGIGSEQVSYVECHATATHLGDAIEVKGLLDAFTEHRHAGTAPGGSTALGSVKGNIGHANCAAGITGLIKTVLCLHHRTLVPTVHYRTLNPKLVEYVDCDGSPFTIQQATAEWTVADPGTQLPRRAGVSSFGIGGTNAHVILEEAPARTYPEPDAGDRLRLVPVSARSETAFRRNALALADALDALPPARLAPAVRALQTRRESHPLRGVAILDGVQGDGLRGGTEELRRLAEQSPARGTDRGVSVVFCFAGQGSQAAGMARGLYRGRADGGRFRGHFDAACAALAEHLPEDPARSILDADEAGVLRPLVTQCGLFAVEYAIAHSLLDLGIRPVAVAGHSIGEYAAAELAGLLGLDEAAALVAARAQATDQLPSAGGMLSVLGDRQRLAGWLAGRPGLWLAAENGPGQVVLAGTATALAAAAEELAGLGLLCRPVPVSHPFHSDLMAPVAGRVAAAAAGLAARVPALPLASNLTGGWFDARYQPAGYWPAHVTSTVRWREDVAALLQWEPDVVLEIGPGSTLTSFARKCLAGRTAPPPVLLPTMPGAKDPDADDEADFLRALGELWCQGADLNLAALEPAAPAGPPAAHLLPTYSFDRTSFWTRPEASVYVGRAAAPATTAPAGPLVRFATRPDARLTLYCLPYAGGSADSFRGWALAAPDWLDLVAVEPPRDGADDGGEDTDALDRLAAAIRADAGERPVAFCGLSFGASLALDLLTGPLADWARDGRVTAASLIGRAVIGAPGAAEAPDCPAESYLMVPDELAADEGWRQAMLPLLGADLGFDARSEGRVAQRRAARGRPLLDCPVQVQCGSDDPSFPSDTAGDWAAVTASPVVEVCRHEGGHDFMLHRRGELLARLVTFLDRLQPPHNPAPGQWQGRLHQVRWAPAVRRSPVDAAPDWLDLDEAGLPAAAEFLRARLTAPDRTVALVSRLGAERSPAEHCERFRALLTGAVTAEARGTLVLVLPARDTSGLVAGLTRTLVIEEPGLAVQRVYLPADEPVDRLLRRVRALPEEPDLLVRGGHLLGRRLLPVTLPDLPAGTLGADSAGDAGSYLLTGGTGGIGRAVVDWLIQHQGVAPGRLIVTGRAPAADLPTGVRYLPLALGRPVDVPALAARTGPLAGLLHLAGALDDGVLRNLTEARFVPVLAPKLALAMLTELARVAGAPWVVAFSSTSSLLGAGGQANYAAANGWLDAHAGWPERAGGPELVSVNWGTWAGVGMAVGDARIDELARAGGETPLSPGTALQLLGQVIGALLAGAAPAGNLAACQLDWPSTPWAGTPLVRDLAAPTRAAGSQPAEPAPEPVAGDRVQTFLSDYIHRWDESKRLAELGLDSLDFARMRGDFARRFGKDVPLTAIARPNQRLSELYALLTGYQGGGEREDEPGLSYAGD